ncbi:MAG TPA: calcium-dependent protein kinase 21 [Xanthomonadaceae bacterium]|jgi:Ca2+-binding EF-hand superfamily protein
MRARSSTLRGLNVRVACVLLASAGFLVDQAVPAQGLPDSPSEYLQRMDSDHDGRVSRDEYLAWMMRNFDSLDADGNGVLEGDELPPGSKPITRDAYRTSLESAFARQDGNHDGWLDARELARPPR